MAGEGLRHALYKLYFQVEAAGGEAELRDEILRRANEAGLRVFSGSCSEVYLEKAFDDLPRRPDLPNARRLTATSLMVEVHPTLRPDLLELRAQRLAEIAQDVLSRRR
jgi:dTDP-4-amino-4,6-dideoxygalactose transaminase